MLDGQGMVKSNVMFFFPETMWFLLVILCNRVTRGSTLQEDWKTRLTLRTKSHGLLKEIRVSIRSNQRSVTKVLIQ